MAAAPPTAQRIKKLRRSTPGGIGFEINRLVSASGSSRTTSPGFSVEPSLSSNFSFPLFDMVHLLTFQIESAANRVDDSFARRGFAAKRLHFIDFVATRYCQDCQVSWYRLVLFSAILCVSLRSLR